MAGLVAMAITLASAAKTAATFRVIDGVRYSMPGDHALIDADGTVHLLGRGSICINTGGEKVFPEEVEVAARSHPGVLDCAAIGMPDERFGEIVTLVVARAEPTLMAQELIDHIKACIATSRCSPAAGQGAAIARSSTRRSTTSARRSISACRAMR